MHVQRLVRLMGRLQQDLRRHPCGNGRHRRDCGEHQIDPGDPVVLAFAGDDGSQI